MSPQRWTRIQEIFDEAAERAPEEADEFVREECGNDQELFSAVMRMLEQHRASGFLDRPPMNDTPNALSFVPDSVVAGRYKIVRLLGRGGMGQVYEADDLDLHEHVALKTLLPEVAAESGMIARFKREIQLSRKVGHAHVCRVFDLVRHPADGSSPNPVFLLTMELLAGETLSQRIARTGRMPPGETLQLLRQMADGLDAAHRLGIIHRDFKPSNVMLVPSSETNSAVRAVITDFGLARQIMPTGGSTATASGRLIGTIEYMAPELFTGEMASPWSDQYALGLVAYKMVTGRLPFEGRAPLGGVVRRAGEAAPSPLSIVPDLDPRWELALARVLQLTPGCRFSACREFVSAISGDSQSVTLKLPPMTRRNIAGAVTGAALLIATPFAWRARERARARPSPEAEASYRRGIADLLSGSYFAASRALEKTVALAPSFALGHAKLAEAWSNLDLNDKASQEMLVARRQDLSALSPVDRLQVEAVDLTITREFAAAAAKYEEAIKLAGVQADELYLQLGRAYENAGKPDKSVDSYTRGTALGGQNPSAWLALGVLNGRRGNLAKADEAFQQAEQGFRSANSLEGITELAFQRGVSASDHDQFEAASTFLVSALETARLAGNVHQEVRSKLWLSANAFRSGDGGLAEDYARQALDTARANRIDSLAVRGLVNLGHAYNRKRDYAGAERYYREALTMARSGSSARLTAISLLSLAAIHDPAARYKEAESEAAEALSFYQANSFVTESFQCLTILGRARLWGAEDPKGAEGFFQKAVATSAKMPDRNLKALAEESLGTTLAAQQRYPDALPHFQKEQELATTEERRGYASLNRGEMLWLLGRYGEAEEAFRAAEGSAAKFPAMSLQLLRARSAMRCSQKRYPEAMTAARQALAMDAGKNLRQRADLDATLGATLARSGDRAGGLRICRQALEEATQVGQTILVIKCRISLAQVLIDSSDRAGAMGVLRGNEPDPARYPEVRWRVLALMQRADPRLTGDARVALEQLSRFWGEEAFRGYLSRPDVRELSSPLLGSDDAKH